MYMHEDKTDDKFFLFFFAMFSIRDPKNTQPPTLSLYTKPKRWRLTLRSGATN